MSNANHFPPIKPDKLNFFVRGITAALYLLAAALMFSLLKTKINPDGIAYLTIAKNYAGGHWVEAVSAYWSPLLSWVLAPFCWLPVEPLFIFYVLNVLAGLAGIGVFSALMVQLRFGQITQYFLLPVCAVFMLRFAFYTSTPDLISVVLLLFFLLYWLKGNLFERPLITAVWMAVLYFVKAYNVYFVTGLICYEALALLLNKRIAWLRLGRNLVLLYVLFLVIISPWLFALNHKYGSIMLAGTAGFNHGAAVVKLSLLDKGIPGTATLRDNYDFFTVFVDPPHKYSVFAWEDPVAKASYRDYAVFSSRENFLLQLRVIYTNICQLLNGGSDMLTIIAFGIGLLLIGFFIKAKAVFKKTASVAWLLDQDISKLSIFSCIYLSGYILLFIEDRYLWINVMTGLLGLGYITGLVVATQQKFSRRQLFWPVCIALLLAISTLTYQLQWLHFFQASRNNAQIGRAEYSFGQLLRSVKAYEKHMAHWPDKADNSLYVSWFTAYFAEGRHYNCLPGEISRANELIIKDDISIVFVSDTAKLGVDFVINTWKKVVGPVPDTDVYIKP